jgi:hypothetical protein
MIAALTRLEGLAWILVQKVEQKDETRSSQMERYLQKKTEIVYGGNVSTDKSDKSAPMYLLQ